MLFCAKQKILDVVLFMTMSPRFVKIGFLCLLSLVFPRKAAVRKAVVKKKGCVGDFPSIHIQDRRSFQHG